MLFVYSLFRTNSCITGINWVALTCIKFKKKNSYVYVIYNIHFKTQMHISPTLKRNINSSVVSPSTISIWLNKTNVKFYLFTLVLSFYFIWIINFWLWYNTAFELTYLVCISHIRWWVGFDGQKYCRLLGHKSKLLTFHICQFYF